MESAVILIFLSIFSTIELTSGVSFQVERLRYSEVAAFGSCSLASFTISIFTINFDLEREQIRWHWIADVTLGSVCGKLMI